MRHTNASRVAAQDFQSVFDGEIERHNHADVAQKTHQSRIGKQVHSRTSEKNGDHESASSSEWRCRRASSTLFAMSQSSISFVPHLPPHLAAQKAEKSQNEYSISGENARNNALENARRPTFALYTLGCKVNQYDSHQISRALMQRGFRRVEFRETADLYVIDTCTVTAEADRKSRKAAGRAHRNNLDAVVAITGCAAAYARDQFLLVAPNALVLDNSRKLELPELAIAELRKREQWNLEYSTLREQIGSEPMPASTRERAVLKIQDGCNHNCSYCIIPTVRGASVVKSRANVMNEARAFVSEGARELIITGVSMSDWKDQGSGFRFSGLRASANSSSLLEAATLSPDPRPQTPNPKRRNAALCSLIRAISTVEGLERVRVSSLDPADVDDEFLETIAKTNGVCPHIHLALQSGSAPILRAMRRRYTPQMFLQAAKRWREIRPDGGLTTDVIVGFPGESDDDFECSFQMVRDANFSAIHVFPYSPRVGTVAAQMGNFVSPPVQKKRVERLIALGEELSANYASQFVGQIVPVLAEENGREGLTPHYLKARFSAKTATSSTRSIAHREIAHREIALENVALESVAPGDIVWMRATSWHKGALEGEIVARPQTAS